MASSCCYPDVKHEDQPAGRFEGVDDFEVDIKEPEVSSDQGILLFFVLMPDLWHQDPCLLNAPPDFNIQKWFAGGYSAKKIPPTPANIDPVVQRAIPEMRGTYGIKYVVRHLSSAEDINVGFVAQPTYVGDDECQSIQGPLAIAAAETDIALPPKKRHHAEEMLKQTGRPYQINLYSGVGHGFAIHGDAEKRQVQFAKESAFFQAVQWFNEHL